MGSLQCLQWGVAGGGWEAPALPYKPLTAEAETPHIQKLPDTAVPQSPMSLGSGGMIQGLIYWRIKNITGKLLNQAHIAFSGVYREGSMICFLFAKQILQDPNRIKQMGGLERAAVPKLCIKHRTCTSMCPGSMEASRCLWFSSEEAMQCSLARSELRKVSFLTGVGSKPEL